MKKKIVKIVFAVFIILFLIIQIYPVIWLFIASVKPSVELASAPFALPKSVTFENFVKVLSDGKIGTYMWNSLKVTGISLLLIVVLSATAGYALSKFKVRGTKKIYSFFTFGIMVPVQITLIPLFIFYSDMGILNTSFSLILPQVGFALPLSVMMFVNFYDFVPNELIEASIVDGCSPYRTFLQIVFPLARNTVISDTEAKTVALGLKDYVGAFGNVDWGSTFAAIAISILPPLVIYFALNKWVTAGMTMGATKG